MEESTLKSASEVDAATVVTSPKKPLEKGKREAEDAIEEEILSAKKLRMEETDISSKEDTSCANSKQEIKVKLCAENGLVDSESGNERIGLVEEASVAEKKPSIAINDGHSAASKRKDESIDDSDCSAEDETSLHEVAAATEKAHESLTKKDIVAPAKKTNDSNSSSADITNLNEDIAAPNEATIILSAEKSVVSTKKKDVVNSDEIHSDVTCSDKNVTTAKKAPIIYPTERGLVISKKKKNESSSNDGSACEDDVNAKITSEVVTIKKNVSTGESESESDNETSRLDDEPKAPVTPKEQPTGPKTLFVGNLSFSVEREDVEDFFKAAGEVVNIRFGMNLDESFRGFGYVEFSSTEAAEKALHELNGKELLHRPVRLDLMKNRGRYTQYSSSKDTLPFQRGGRAEGQRRFVRGFNKFDGEDQALHEHNGKEILPHPVRPDFVKERGLYIPYSGSKDTQFQNGGRAQGKKVFVCGFNKIDGEYQIRSSLEEHFGSCGEISRVSVPKDQDGSVRGIAFIDFKDNDGFTQALKLNGSEFRGSTLSVEEAKPRWDGRDNSGGSSSGCGWRRGGGREFGGRSGGWDLGGSSGRRDFGGRSGRWDFNGRGGRQDFSGRSGGWDFGGRGGRQDFGCRSGGWDFGGRDGRQDFGGVSGGWDFGGRSGRQNFGGRSGGWDLQGRSGRQDFGGRSGSRGGGGFGGGGRSWNWNESTIRQ